MPCPCTCARRSSVENQNSTTSVSGVRSRAPVSEHTVLRAFYVPLHVYILTQRSALLCFVPYAGQDRENPARDTSCISACLHSSCRDTWGAVYLRVWHQQNQAKTGGCTTQLAPFFRRGPHARRHAKVVTHEEGQLRNALHRVLRQQRVHEPTKRLQTRKPHELCRLVE